MVTLTKGTDGTRAINPGAGANDGSGPLRFIGGLPVRRVEGAVLRVAGMQVRGEWVRSVIIEGGTAWLVMDGGRELWTGDMGPLTVLRRQWIRRLLDTGTFAGVSRMR
jgi:hypothetical protein